MLIVQQYLVELETSRTVMLPPTVSVLWLRMPKLAKTILIEIQSEGCAAHFMSSLTIVFLPTDLPDSVTKFVRDFANLAKI